MSATYQVWVASQNVTDDVLVATVNRQLTELLGSPRPGVAQIAIDNESGAYSPVTNTDLIPNAEVFIWALDNTDVDIITGESVSMTGAASGSNGIQVAHNTEFDLGTSDAYLGRKVKLPNTTPSASVFLSYKFNSGSDRWGFFLQSDGTLTFFVIVGGTVHISSGDAQSTEPVPASGGEAFEAGVNIERGTSNVTLTYYVDGVQLGDPVVLAVSDSVDFSNNGELYLSGTHNTRFESENYSAHLFNRALSAAEVLDLYNNGIAEADKWGSQTPVYESDFSAGTDGWGATGGSVDGNIDSIGGENDWLRFTIDSSTGQHRMQKASSLPAIDKNGKISFTYYLPSSNSDIDQLRVRDSDNNTLLNITNPTLDAVTTIEKELITTVQTSTEVRVWGQSSSGGTLFTGNGTDVFYIKNFESKQIGATLALEQSGIGQLNWQDSSDNNNDAEYPDRDRFDLFKGFANQYTARPQHGRRALQVEAEDRAKFFTRQLETSMRVDYAVNSLFYDILDSINMASVSSIDTAISDLAPYAVYQDQQAVNALTDLLSSGAHRMYIAPDGTIRIKDRNSIFVNTNVSTIDNEFYNFSYRLSAENVRNQIRVTAAPRKAPTSVTSIGFLDDVSEIPAGGSISFFMVFRDPESDEERTPCNSVAAPTATTDWLLNSLADGGGSDLTAQGSVTASIFMRAAQVTVRNTSGTDAFLTKMYMRGFPLQRKPPFTSKVDASSSQAQYEIQKLDLDNDIIPTQSHVSDYAAFLSSYFKDPRADIVFAPKVNNIPAILSTDLTDTVHIVEDETGLDERRVISEISHTINLTSGVEHSVEYRTEPLAFGEFLILDDATLGKLDIRRLSF